MNWIEIEFKNFSKITELSWIELEILSETTESNSIESQKKFQTNRIQLIHFFS